MPIARIGTPVTTGLALGDRVPVDARSRRVGGRIGGTGQCCLTQEHCAEQGQDGASGSPALLETRHQSSFAVGQTSPARPANPACGCRAMQAAQHASVRLPALSDRRTTNTTRTAAAGAAVGLTVSLPWPNEVEHQLGAARSAPRRAIIAVGVLRPLAHAEDRGQLAPATKPVAVTAGMEKHANDQ